MKKVGVALLGLGTVGGGTYTILTENREAIMRKSGVDVEIRHIIERDRAKAERAGVDMSIVSSDINDVLNDRGTTIAAEFFGGIEPAKTYLIKCLLAGKSIVTANKEMFSKNWPELEEAGKKGGAGLYFEASCVGGVPIIRTLTQSLQGDNILSLMGIVNGTTNFILSKMADEGGEFSEVLKEAQALGYAEADPTADVEGYDSTYKLSILSSLAFNVKVPVDKIYREGIAKIDGKDILYGKKFGYTLKLLAIAKKSENGLEVRVNPAFIPDSHPLSAVKGSFNAVHIVGDSVGDIMLYGRGAGALPTGSAIVSDIVFAAKREVPEYAAFDIVGKGGTFIRDFVCDYYIRMTVDDRAGVLSKIAKVFGEHDASINAMTQNAEEGAAEVIFLIHKTRENNINASVAELKKLACVKSVDAIIRVER